ncbi:MAG: NAD-dependent epimerase/dehydratase family protein [Bryobacteraceae bacterium]
MPSRKSLLITGGSGFIGSALVRRLAGEGHGVTLLVSPWFDESRLADLAGAYRVFRDPDAAVAFADPDVIYHLASTPFHPASRRAHEHYDAIVTRTVALLDAARARRGVRFVFTGSCAEYGEGSRLREDSAAIPGTVLGAAKLAATNAVLAWARWFGMEAVVLRLFTPYGPGEAPGRLIPHLVRSLERGAEVALSGDGMQQRDYVYLGDVVEALVAAALQTVACAGGGQHLIGRGISARDVAATVGKAMGVEPVISKFRTGAVRRDHADVGRQSARRGVTWLAATGEFRGRDRADGRVVALESA